MTNCIVSGNTASVNGGGIYNDVGSPALTNCSVSGNVAADGGGMYSKSDFSSPTLNNCILWGNTGGEISGTTPTVTYSIIEGGFTGTGNLDKDPLFVDAANGNLGLQACSPAIDSGNNATVTATTDLDGNTRIMHNTVDMGAYEYNGTLYTFYPDADGDSYGSKTANSIRTSFCSTTFSNEAVNNTDCNDDNAAINPNTVWVLDKDNDGYYTGSAVTQCASPGAGYIIKTTQQGGDCNDNDAGVNPGAVEVCGNGIDDNCNGKTDETGCALCQNATGLKTTNITLNGATLNWTALANPVQWKIEYKKLTIGSKWVTITVPGYLRSTNLSSLLANQKYQWHISAKCGKTWTSFSDAVMFKTLAQQANSIIAQQSLQNITDDKLPAVKLYPNPTRGQFIIELGLSDNVNANAKIELVNMMGQRVSEENANINNGVLRKTVSISSSLAKGIYMIKVIANNKMYVSKLIYEK